MSSKKVFEFQQDNLKSTRFDNLWRKGELCDVSIHVGEKTFQAHRVILSCVFPYFSAMFRSKMLEGRAEEISLKDVDPDSFEQLLHFAYTGKIQGTKSVQVLLLTVDYLQHRDLRQACIEFLTGQLLPDNALTLRMVAESVGCENFVEETELFIAENFDALYKTEEFVNIPFSFLKKLINRTDLRVKNELNVVEAITRWVKAFAGRNTMLVELLSCIRLPLLRNEGRAKNKKEQTVPAKTKSFLQEDQTPLVNEDVFGIYAVCFSSGSGRAVHNYNSYTGTWAVLNRVHNRIYFKTVVSACGRIYAFSQNELEVFDRREWISCGVLPWPVRRRTGNAVSLDSKIYWFPNVFLNSSVWCFDVRSKKWSEGASCVKLCNAGFVAFGGYVYILGGVISSVVTSAVKTYDPHRKEFKEVSPMLSRRSNPGCAALNEKIYVCGGYSGSYFLATAEECDPMNDQWRFISQMTDQMSKFSVVPHCGRLYAVGAQTSEDNSVQIYDPVRRSWEAGQDFPGSYTLLQAVVVYH